MESKIEDPVNDKKSLIPSGIEGVSAKSLFVDNGLPSLLDRIENEARRITPDTSTDKGRKGIASNAYRVARTKTFLDALGKDFVSGLKLQVKTVDNQRLLLRNRLDNLRDEVRKPLTEIEAAEKAHDDAIKERINTMLEPWPGDIDEIRARLESLEKTLVDESFSRFINDASVARNKAIVEGRQALCNAEATEEAERKRIAEEEQARKDREARIAKEAAESAKRRAEANAKAEIVRVERERVEAERQHVAAENRAAEAERRAKEEIKRRVQEAKEAEQNAKARADASARQEREKIAAEQRAEENRKQQLANDKNHREKINAEIVNAFKTAGVNGVIAKLVVSVICDGDIPHVSINY